MKIIKRKEIEKIIGNTELIASVDDWKINKKWLRSVSKEITKYCNDMIEDYHS